MRLLNPTGWQLFGPSDPLCHPIGAVWSDRKLIVHDDLAIAEPRRAVVARQAEAIDQGRRAAREIAPLRCRRNKRTAGGARDNTGGLLGCQSV